MQPNSKILCQEENVINEDAPHQLQKYLGNSCLILERVRYGNQVPICYQLTTVITNHCPGLIEHDFSKESLYEVLAKEYRMIITRIEHLMRAVGADDFRAELLDVEAGAPLLFVSTVAYLENGEVIETTLSQYRADRYEYRTAEERYS